MKDALKLNHSDLYRSFDGHKFFDDKVLKFEKIIGTKPLKIVAKIVKDDTEYADADKNNVGSSIYIELDTASQQNVRSFEQVLLSDSCYLKIGLDSISAYFYYGKFFVTTNYIEFIPVSDETQSQVYVDKSLEEIKAHEAQVDELQEHTIESINEFFRDNIERFLKEESFRIVSTFYNRSNLRFTMEFTSDNINHGKLFTLDVVNLKEDEIPKEVITDRGMELESLAAQDVIQYNPSYSRLFLKATKVKLRMSNEEVWTVQSQPKSNNEQNGNDDVAIEEEVDVEENKTDSVTQTDTFAEQSSNALEEKVDLSTVEDDVTYVENEEPLNNGDDVTTIDDTDGYADYYHNGSDYLNQQLPQPHDE